MDDPIHHREAVAVSQLDRLDTDGRSLEPVPASPLERLESKLGSELVRLLLSALVRRPA